MTAIGKLLAVLTLVVGLGILTWSVGVYVSRPGWFNPPPEGGIDKGNNPVGFAQVKAESEALTRSAAVASEAWGTHLKLLEEREKYRAARKAAAEQVNKIFGEKVYNWWDYWTLWGILSQPYVNGVQRNILPDKSKALGLAFAGRHQLNEMWCDDGKCE